MTTTARLFALFLLLFFFARLMVTASVMSVTFDEVLHIFQGVLYWQQRALRPVVENPPLINALIGLPVTLALSPRLPLDHPLWPSSDWEGLAQLFMWQANSNGRQLIFAGRVPIMLLATLLGALLYRWSRDLTHNRWVGLTALLFYTFDPNVLAHGHLASTDLGITFFLFLAAFLVWCYWRAPDHGRYLAAAIGLGGALAAKFSALVLLPALLLMSSYRLLMLPRQERRWRRTAVELAGWFIIAGLIFLAIYRFNGATLLADFNGQRAHQLTGHSAFLLGEISQSGWWYYFPAIFAIKTPLPVLLLIATGLALFSRQGQWRWQWLWPLLLAGGIGAAGLISRVNIGYRYLLPALPLLYLFAGRLAGPAYAHRPWVKWWVVTLAAWIVTSSLAAHPHYLAYFNEIVGGREEGWRYAADSNVDWGQDMQALGEYVAARRIESVYMAWHGLGLPAAYGVSAIPLVVRTAALGDEPWPAFYPDWPAPGVYVLSVTHLHGVYLPDPTYFHWFRQRPPADKVGASLFVYHVPATGLPVPVALSGIDLRDITLPDYGRAWASNDVRPRWYDARSAMLWAGDGMAMGMAVGDGHLPQHPALQRFYPADGPLLTGENDRGRRYHLYRWPAPAAQAGWEQIDNQAWLPDRPQAPALLTPVAFNDTWLFLGHEIVDQRPYYAGDQLQLLTYWRVLHETAVDLTIFVHLLDAEGRLVAQHDGLDVVPKWTRPGDELAQLHTVQLPQDLPPGLYRLQLGLYDRNSLERWLVATAAGAADRLLLEPIQIGQ
jgi:4-amino-4-deoxy-L-arabinose transferase-like glycosyltransferase